MPPPHGYVKRDKNLAEIFCHISNDDTWEIICDDGEWTGDIGNCSAGRTLLIHIINLKKCNVGV